MNVRDWRVAPPDVVAPLFASEVRRWRAHLAWDTASIWTRVEDARRLGYLPGLLIRDDAGRVRGWSFHLLHAATLQVGALVTDSCAATRAWLDALARTPEAAASERCQCFGWFDSPGVRDGLREAGLDVQAYHYLQHGDAAGPPVGSRIPQRRAWHSSDLAGVAALLSAAYPGADDTRPFAPTGTSDAWIAYCGQIVNGDANGMFDPALSVVDLNKHGGIEAAALVTRLAPDTAHIAQLAVHPARHGCGLGRTLLAEVLARAHTLGCPITTLLVSERNQPARALYASAGFTTRATFLSATGTLALRTVVQKRRVLDGRGEDATVGGERVLSGLEAG